MTKEKQIGSGKKRIGTVLLASAALAGCASHVNKPDGGSPNKKSVPEHIDQKPSGSTVNTVKTINTVTTEQKEQQSEDKTQQILWLLTTSGDFNGSLAPAREGENTVRDVVGDESNKHLLDDAASAQMGNLMEANNITGDDVVDAVLSGNKAVFIWAQYLPGNSSYNEKDTLYYNENTPRLSADSPVTPGTIIDFSIYQGSAQAQHEDSTGQ
jgi:hypothetical protein